MGKMKTLDFIADHVACSYVEEMQEQISELLYAEGIIEEMDDVTCDIVDEVKIFKPEVYFDHRGFFTESFNNIIEEELTIGL